MNHRAITILAVEDEPSVLAIVRITLERAGYRVLAATSAEAAIALASEHAASIGLLVLDVIMPELSGPELHKRLQAQFPIGDIPTLYISGYPDVFCTELDILEKPFTAERLLKSVEHSLAANVQPSAKKAPQSQASLGAHKTSRIG